MNPDIRTEHLSSSPRCGPAKELHATPSQPWLPRVRRKLPGCRVDRPEKLSQNRRPGLPPAWDATAVRKALVHVHALCRRQQPRAAPVTWPGRPAESGRGLSVPGSRSQPTARSPALHPLQPGDRGWGGKRAFVSDLKRLFQNGFLFFILFFLLSLEARKRKKTTPRIHFKPTTKRRRGSSQMLMFCFLT